MPLRTTIVDGFDALKKELQSVGEKRVFVFFSGSHVDGKSWCPDCVSAEPVVQHVLSKPEVKQIDAIFISCFVGQRDYWKDSQCPFRTEEDFKLNCIPTLIEYGKSLRIVDDQVSNEKAVFDFVTSSH